MTIFMMNESEDQKCLKHCDLGDRENGGKTVKGGSFGGKDQFSFGQLDFEMPI